MGEIKCNAHIACRIAPRDHAVLIAGERPQFENERVDRSAVEGEAFHPDRRAALGDQVIDVGVDVVPVQFDDAGRPKPGAEQSITRGDVALDNMADVLLVRLVRPLSLTV